MSNWQPIETVPPGRQVLLFTPHYARAQINMAVGSFDQDSGRYWGVGGISPLYEEFTHWMDLPDDPRP